MCDKPLQTRDGKKVQIFMRNAGARQYPVLGAYFEEDRWIQADWSIDGLLLDMLTQDNDLVNVPASTKVKQTCLHLHARGAEPFFYFIDKPLKDAISVFSEEKDYKILAAKEIEFEITEGEGL